MKPNKTVVYTYGDTIYNPGNNPIDDYIIAHEEIHERQQGNNPKAWWDKYLKDKKFRLEQEIDAHIAQYREYCKQNKDKNYRFRYLNEIAKSLSSETYGNILTKQEVFNLIQ